MTDVTSAPAPRKRTRKMAREAPSPNSSQPPEDVTPPQTPEPGKIKTKAALVLKMLKRTEGTTLEDLVAATGWLAHTTRAALTGIRKKGHALSSDKIEGVRRYRVAPPADGELKP